MQIQENSKWWLHCQDFSSLEQGEVWDEAAVGSWVLISGGWLKRTSRMRNRVEILTRNLSNASVYTP